MVVGRHAGTAGRKGTAIFEWPSQTTLPRSPSRFTSVLFLHPECPCSVASLAELELFMAAGSGRIDFLAVVTRPNGWKEDIEQSASWKRARAIPGLKTYTDNQREAIRFGAQTSGHLFLFAPSGQRVFEGGITAARGHQGENSGLRAAMNLALGKVEPKHSASVFGCAL